VKKNKLTVEANTIESEEGQVTILENTGEELLRLAII
jgi:hypothetical protein